MTLLAIETSCDETGVAIIREGRVLSNVVASQTAIHAEYGGVVPELATREHLRNFMPVAAEALRQASVTPAGLDAVAVTRGPGLPSALLAGLKAGQALAFCLRKPIAGIHHLEAHLYSPWILADPPRGDFAQFEPSVSLVASGGHTLLVHVRGLFNHRVLGATLDDAAGECFDKIGKLMGLAYPAGAQIDRLAADGNPKAFQFPRPMLAEANDDFSFAGLKTSVRYFLEAAIVEVLAGKTARAARRLGARCVTASGGVACNNALRRELAAACAQAGMRLRLAERVFSTDNAAMIGILAERKLMAGAGEMDLDAEIEPNWALPLA